MTFSATQVLALGLMRKSKNQSSKAEHHRDAAFLPHEISFIRNSGKSEIISQKSAKSRDFVKRAELLLRTMHTLQSTHQRLGTSCRRWPERPGFYDPVSHHGGMPDRPMNPLADARAISVVAVEMSFSDAVASIDRIRRDRRAARRCTAGAWHYNSIRQMIAGRR